MEQAYAPSPWEPAIRKRCQETAEARGGGVRCEQWVGSQSQAVNNNDQRKQSASTLWGAKSRKKRGGILCPLGPQWRGKDSAIGSTEAQWVLLQVAARVLQLLGPRARTGHEPQLPPGCRVDSRPSRSGLCLLC